MSIVYPVVMTAIRTWFGGRSKKILRKDGQGFRHPVMGDMFTNASFQLSKSQMDVWLSGKSRPKREL